MSPYAYDPDHLRFNKQQARSVQRVQTTMATIMVAAFVLVALVLFARGCQNEPQGWTGDAHATLTKQ